MLPPHLHKFTDLYGSYGLGAVKNFWLLTCLIPLARTVNLNKMKDYVGGVLGNENTDPDSNYKRLIRFFQDWGGREDLLHDLMRQNLRLLRTLGFKTLVMMPNPKAGAEEPVLIFLTTLPNAKKPLNYMPCAGKSSACSNT